MLDLLARSTAQELLIVAGALFHRPVLVRHLLSMGVWTAKIDFARSS